MTTKAKWKAIMEKSREFWKCQERSGTMDAMWFLFVHFPCAHPSIIIIIKQDFRLSKTDYRLFWRKMLRECKEQDSVSDLSALQPEPCCHWPKLLEKNGMRMWMMETWEELKIWITGLGKTMNDWRKIGFHNNKQNNNKESRYGEKLEREKP